MGDARVAHMIEEARAGQITFGSSGGFLRDLSASFNFFTLYVAELLSVDLGAHPIAAIGAAQHAEEDEQSDESVEGADHADPVAALVEGAYDRDIRF